MEELVTVDEVGGEDDSIIEPDLSELEEFASCPKESAGQGSLEERTTPPTSSVEVQEAPKVKSMQDETVGEDENQAAAPVIEKDEHVSITTTSEDLKTNTAAPELQIADLSEFPSEEFKAALEETCLEDSKEAKTGPQEQPMENHISVAEDNRAQEVQQLMEPINNGVQHKDGLLRKGTSQKRPTTKSYY